MSCSSIEKKTVSGINLNSLDQLKLGMSQKQVGAILGFPSEIFDFSTTPAIKGWLFAKNLPEGRVAVVTVYFGANMEVISKIYETTFQESKSYLTDIESRYNVVAVLQKPELKDCTHSYSSTENVYKNNETGLVIATNPSDGHVTMLSWSTPQWRQLASMENQRICHLHVQ